MAALIFEPAWASNVVMLVGEKKSARQRSKMFARAKIQRSCMEIMVKCSVNRGFFSALWAYAGTFVCFIVVASVTRFVALCAILF